MRLKQGRQFSFFLAAGIGFSACILSIVLRNDLRLGSGSVLACGVSRLEACAKVALDPLAKGFFGISTGALGAAYFFLLVLFSKIIPAHVGRVLVFTAAAVGLGLFTWSLFSVGQVCFYCVLADASLFLLFSEITFFNSRLLSAHNVGLVVAVVYLGAFALAQVGLGYAIDKGIYSLFAKSRSWDADAVPVRWDSLPLLQTSDPIESGVRVSEGPATRTLHFFGDFKCVYCQTSYTQLQSAMQVTGIPIRIEFHPFPQEAECNPGFEQAGHQGACLAAKIALCGSQRNDKAQIISYLFEHSSVIQKNVNDTLYFIEAAGPRFKGIGDCVKSKWADTQLQNQLGISAKVGVYMTPTFVMGRRKLQGSPARNDWISLLMDWSAASDELKNGI